MKRFLTLVVLVFLLFSFSTFSKNNSQLINIGDIPIPSRVDKVATPSASSSAPEETIKVTRVLDGDTIETEKNNTRTRVRYTGVDSPESGDCFGQEASNANFGLVFGKEVTLETDVQVLDKYGRTLAYVWLDGKLINEELVRTGYAKVSTYPPNVKYQDRFREAEREAREEKRGLWAPDACIVRQLQTTNGSKY